MGSEAVTHEVSFPRPGWAEQDPEAWWEEFSRICRVLLSRGDVRPEEVKAIGCSGMMPTVVALDASSTPLRPAILYGIDSRAADEIRIIQQIQASSGETGRALTSQSAAPKVLWLKRNEPEVFRKACTIVSATGFLVYRLTGIATIDVPTAVEFNPLFDPVKLEWDPRWCCELGIPQAILPRVVPATEVVGRVTPWAAQKTGIPAGTPVIAGTGDVLADRLAMGMTLPGDSALTYGTTMTVSVLVKSIKNDSRLLIGPYVIPGLYRVSGATNASGSLLSWLCRILGSDAETDDWRRRIEQDASGIEPGSEGLIVLPYFNGERTPIFDDRVRGLIAGLTLSHTPAHIYRAFIEATAYALLHNLEVMEENGCRPERVVSSGGGTRSELWLQIVSDVTGLEQVILDQLWGAPLGAAFLAAIATGAIGVFEEVKTWTRPQRIIRPNAERSRLYADYYRVFRQLYLATRPYLHQLSR
ncbi:sugar kinase [Gelria sp. Kuro-4]|nr:sugar kinase [Gelria sp. Kuro-4]